jgi:ADP-ribosyl-[dinitrogen reductase] hydrolase
MNISMLDKKQTAMLGALLGDALGVPHEFKGEHAINQHFVDHPTQITDEYKTYGVPLGVYSDDFSQMLCVNANYSVDPSNPTGFYKDLLLWQKGKYWVSAQKFDEGLQTASQLRYYGMKEDIKIHEEQMSGNGSLMRVLPIAFMASDVTEMNIWTFQCSAITHNSHECIMACQFYNILARMIADQPGKVDTKTFLNTWEVVCGVLQWNPETSWKPDLGSGYVIDTLNMVKDCIQYSDSFENAVKRAIRYGQDTDTNASVVGGIAALVFGLEDIPQEWLTFIAPSLENRYVDELFNHKEEHESVVH